MNQVSPPDGVQLGIYQLLRTGTPTPFEAETAGGVQETGVALAFSLLGTDGAHLAIHDTRWSNGERDVRVVQRHGTPELYDSVVGRLRLTVSPAGMELAVDLRQARPGADYANSLKLLQDFRARHPHIPTKSGLMLGLGETDDEILAVMRDRQSAAQGLAGVVGDFTIGETQQLGQSLTGLVLLRGKPGQGQARKPPHGVDMLTIGQYLQPSAHHLPVLRYAPLDVFAMLEREARALGFSHAAVGPMVRSSYHADRQAHAAGVA